MKLVLAVGKLDEDPFPLDRERGLELTSSLEVGEVGAAQRARVKSTAKEPSAAGGVGSSSLGLKNGTFFSILFIAYRAAKRPDGPANRLSSSLS